MDNAQSKNDDILEQFVASVEARDCTRYLFLILSGIGKACFDGIKHQAFQQWFRQTAVGVIMDKIKKERICILK